MQLLICAMCDCDLCLCECMWGGANSGCDDRNRNRCHVLIGIRDFALIDRYHVPAHCMQCTVWGKAAQLYNTWFTRTLWGRDGAPRWTDPRNSTIAIPQRNVSGMNGSPHYHRSSGAMRSTKASPQSYVWRPRVYISWPDLVPRFFYKEEREGCRRRGRRRPFEFLQGIGEIRTCPTWSWEINN